MADPSTRSGGTAARREPVLRLSGRVADVPWRIAALALLSAAAGLGSLALYATAESPQGSAVATLGRVLVGWAFSGVGLAVWARRPSNNMGRLMTAAGLLWFLPALQNANSDVVFTAGRLMGNLGAPAFFALLTFPTGRIESRGERLLVGAAAIWGTFLTAIATTLIPGERGQGPENLVVFIDDAGVARAASIGLGLGGALLTAALVVLLTRRWRRATGPQRRELQPVVLTGSAAAAAWGAEALISSAIRENAFTTTLQLVSYVLLAGVAFAFLVGLVRARVVAGHSVTRVVRRLAEAPGGLYVQEILADGLGDPSLEVVYPVADRNLFVNAAGEAVDLPATPQRTAVPVERDGELVAVIVYDTAVDRTGDSVAGAGAAAALALENARLEAELRAQVAEVTASRARLAEASDRARQRIGRDLDDGVQRHLADAARHLRRARDAGEGTDSAAHLDAAIAGLDEGRASLQALSRDIHPATLAEHGLAPALRALARQAAVPTTVSATTDERFPRPVETVAYSVVAEALANVAAHSYATHADVVLWQHDGSLVVEVRDDGIGGAHTDRGMGIAGIIDRVAVMDGALTVTSPVGVGTVVRAVLPL